MIRSTPLPSHRDSYLARQQSDFSAEGAPVPGRVAGAAALSRGLAVTPLALDALAWLARGHASLQRLFRDYGHLRQRRGGDFGKALLARRICAQLGLQLQIEEEIFHPAALAVLGTDRTLAHARLDIRGTLELIDRLGALPVDDPDFDATLAVLEAYVVAHMQEVENEIFPSLRQGGLDTVALGAQVVQRLQSLGLDLGSVGAAHGACGEAVRLPAPRLGMP
jgi:hypothetical protein